ncbi:hypothetical protein [Psychroflexus sp. MES1-P1E]|uniref:hypothetical protein n=1 Tax=Psychroflexus sp. MES1-P1E TaxID=2058320 RepID=UPI000C7D294D|nr:hypothetical protein [Psychroflexus sp. MES1-P1E]PKG43876.1 hypothetical protein CXF67_02680 [Psychroflexus sp. MES1-P1E]
MNKLTQYAQHFTKLELMKARLEVFQNESGREGVEFIIKTDTGNYHELYLQTINLEKDRSIKISKSVLGEPKDNLWVALVLFMKEMEPVLYLIPSNQLAKPDDYIFFDNNQSERFSYLSNWEIKVFVKGIPEFSKFALNNIVGQL